MAQENTLLSASQAHSRLEAAGESAKTTRRRGAGGSQPWLRRVARRLATRRLQMLVDGRLLIHEGERLSSYGDGASLPGEHPLEATIEIHDPAFWERVAWGGSIGAAEAYCDGFWTTPDLTSVIRIFARNQEALERMDSGAGALLSPLRRILHHARTNTRSGSIRNISNHYDTGNEFFSKFLDSSLTYSCAIFPGAFSSLDTAQQWKLETICKKLELDSSDHLLEIGTGWGGLAIHAARNHGCRVTTTTISNRQYAYATRAVEDAGLADRVEVIRCDYRDLPARLDQRFKKLVSIEMIEAVGHRYLPAYFETIGRMLRPDGLALLQAITIPDQRYDAYRRTVDFIQHYIFPGGLLPSLSRIQECVRERTDLRLVDLDDLTPHYARTLAAWRERFEAREEEIASLGLSAAERRKWKFYFSYCEGGFLERTVGDVQLLFGKPRNRRDVRPRSLD